MEKKIIPIALSVFSITILLSQSLYVDPKAYALTVNQDFVFNGQGQQCDIMKTTPIGNTDHTGNVYVCIPLNDVGGSVHRMTLMRSDINPTTLTTLDVYPQKGGCDPVSNPCSAVSGSVSCYNCNYDFTTENGQLKGIWCGITDCFTIWQDTTGAPLYSTQLLRITTTGGLFKVTGYMNASTFEYAPFLSGIDLSTGGIGGVSVFAVQCSANPCLAASQGTLQKIGGTSQMGIVQQVTTNQFFASNDGISKNYGGLYGGSIASCWFCDGNTSNSTDTNKIIAIAGQQSGAANRQLTLIRGGTFVEQCGIGAGSTSSINTGTITWTGSNTHKWIFGFNASVKRINSNCTVEATTTYATLGLSNYITGIAVDRIENLMWIHHGSTNTQSTITQANLTSFNTLVNFDSVIGSSISGYIGGSNPHYGLVADPNANTLLRTDSVGRGQILYLNNFAQGSTGGVGGGANVCDNLDHNGDGKVNLLDCLDERGGLGSLTANGNITETGTIICQAVGICDANNENARTNGVGLFLMLITGTFFAIALMSTVHTLHMRGYISASVREIDPIFWLFLVVGTVSVAWYLDWIDDIIFAAMTVGLAGLVAFGVLKHFGRI